MRRSSTRTVRGGFLLFASCATIWNLFVIPSKQVRRATTGSADVLATEGLFAPFTELSTFAEEKSSSSESFSACLLVMDDNHYLTEWLAYHYHVLPLRNLIVAVDPRSRTSPAEIFARWKDRMNITVWWNDADFVTDVPEFDVAAREIAVKFAPGKLSADLIRHRARQRLFYYHCMQEHKKANHTWTLLTDSDEYLAINYDTVRALRSYPDVATAVRPISEPGSVLTLLHHEIENHPRNRITSSPCIQIPRIRFGTVETDRAVVQASLPEGLRPDFNASHMATLRWRNHADASNYKQNKISKVIVDVGRVDWQHITTFGSIHKPIEKYCSRSKLHIRAGEQLLLIHHYLGTKEQYTFRDDSRVGKERNQQVS